MMEEKSLKKLEFDKIRQMLAQRVSSSMGKELAMALQPETDPWVIERWQEETEEGFQMLVRQGEPPFGGIRDLRGLLQRSSVGGLLSMGELLMVADTARSIREIKNFGKRDEDTPPRPRLDPLFDGLSGYHHLEREIERCILSEEEMDDHASEALSGIRRQMNIAQQRVRSQLNEMIHSASYRTMLQDPVVTMRGGRFCLPVKAEFRASVKGMVHDQSATGSTVFVEPMAVVVLNNKVAELTAQEKEEIERILRRLSNMVREVQKELEADIGIMAQLDFIFAKSKLAYDMDGVKPRFDSERRIDLPKARHPLIDPKKVVPIHIMLGGDFTSLIITGPNTGGKTVSLKTLGLLCLMGQAGLHIPAGSGAVLTVVDQVFADIGDEQSIEQSLSTFSSHMVNIVEILKKVTDQSLVLFDELGAGTDPVEGAALANAILEHLRRRRILTAATTHYSELKVYALSTAGVENASCEFDVETLKPTYRLLIGVPGKSNAFAISSRLGLPKEVIEEAKEFLESNDIQFEEMMSELEMRRRQAEEEQDKIRSLRMEITALQKKERAAEEKLAEKQEKILKAAREEAREILRKAKAEADESIQAIQRAIREGAHVDMRMLEENRTRLRKGAKEMEKDLAASADRRKSSVDPKLLVRGTKVRLGTLDQECIVLSPPDSRGAMVVQAGILQMNVRAADITAIVPEKDERPKSAVRPKEQDRGVRAGSFGKSATVSVEVDLRGMNAEEALGTLDKYLDDAYLAGLEKVTVIHGKGTGVLRREVQQFLKRRPQVKSYRLGSYGEGESGVTIVELKTQ